MISRLNSEQRLYPSPSKAAPTVIMPIGTLDYWTQQCGVFYDNVPGDVLFYQSNFFHWFAFVKGSTKPTRGINYIVTGSTGEDVASNNLYNGRYVSNFGKNRELTTAFPTTAPLPVLIPAYGTPGVVVFSSGILNTGTGRQASITWNFQTPTLKKTSLKLIIDNSAGITMQVFDTGSWATLGNIPNVINGDFRVNIGLSSTSTRTLFTMNAINTAGAVVGTATADASTILAGNLSLTSIVHRGEDQGSGSQMLHWGDFISILPAMPTTRLTVQKSLTAGIKPAQTFVGFSGNVWENIKAYCSIYHLDVSCVAGLLTIGPRQTETTPVYTLGTISKRIAARDQARFVEVVCQNSKPTLSSDGSLVVPAVMWKADTVYQVAVGEVQTFNVQTKHSILDLQQPVAVSGISPYPYTSGTGQYVVTGSDGYIVSPTFWRDQGGKITVETTDNEGEIKVTIKGPDFDSVRAPYRISEGDAGRPALYITGQGVINKPVTIRASTGNTKAAKEVGATLDCPFIGDLTLTYDAAARMADKFATPDVSAAITEALDYESPSALGVVPSGQLIKIDGSIFRVTDASQTHAAISGNTTEYNTIYQVAKSFGVDATIADVNAYYAEKTIGQVNLKPLKVVK